MRSVLLSFCSSNPGACRDRNRSQAQQRRLTPGFPAERLQSTTCASGDTEISPRMPENALKNTSSRINAPSKPHERLRRREGRGPRARAAKQQLRRCPRTRPAAGPAQQHPSKFQEETRSTSATWNMRRTAVLIISAAICSMGY